MGINEQLIGWHASDWDELRRIWNELAGTEESAGRDYHSRFGGREVGRADAGYIFQTWIIEALRLSQIEFTPPLRVPTRDESMTLEEIDGFAFLDCANFVIESKFGQVDFGPIARLHLIAERRPPATMALLFAAGGCTPPAIELAEHLRPLRVLLFDRVDLQFVLNEPTPDLGRAIRVKWKAAVERGQGRVLLQDIA